MKYITKLLVTLFLTITLFVSVTAVVSANETCVTQYGGGVVCGVSTPEVPHPPVKAGLEDISPIALAGIFFATAFGLRVYSKKLTSTTV